MNEGGYAYVCVRVSVCVSGLCKHTRHSATTSFRGRGQGQRLNAVNDQEQQKALALALAFGPHHHPLESL